MSTIEKISNINMKKKSITLSSNMWIKSIEIQNIRSYISQNVIMTIVQYISMKKKKQTIISKSLNAAKKINRH